jgi:hypothetical protein
MFKHFRVLNFLSFAVMYFFLLRYTYIISYAIDEGNKVTNAERMIGSIFYVIRYPAWLILPLMRSEKEIFVAVAFNSLLYGLLLERLWYLLTGKWWYPKTDA